MPFIQDGVVAIECYIFIQISRQLHQHKALTFNDIGQFKVVKVRMTTNLVENNFSHNDTIVEDEYNRNNPTLSN